MILKRKVKHSYIVKPIDYSIIAISIYNKIKEVKNNEVQGINRGNHCAGV